MQCSNDLNIPLARWISRLDLTQPVDLKSIIPGDPQQYQNLVSLLTDRYIRIGLGSLLLTPLAGTSLEAHRLALTGLLHHYWKLTTVMKITPQNAEALPYICFALDTFDGRIHLSIEGDLKETDAQLIQNYKDQRKIV